MVKLKIEQQMPSDFTLSLALFNIPINRWSKKMNREASQSADDKILFS